MALQEDILTRISAHYLESPDCNGLRADLLRAELDVHPDVLLQTLEALITSRHVDVSLHPDPRIRGHDWPVEDQIDAVHSRPLQSLVTYPTRATLKGRVAESRSRDQPYLRRRLRGFPEFHPCHFDLAVLARYHADPRYRLEDHAETTWLSMADRNGASVPEQDRIAVQVFGYAYGDDGTRVIATCLLDLSHLSGRQQRHWRAHEVRGTFHREPPSVVVVPELAAEAAVEEVAPEAEITVEQVLEPEAVVTLDEVVEPALEATTDEVVEPEIEPEVEVTAAPAAEREVEFAAQAVTAPETVVEPDTALASPVSADRTVYEDLVDEVRLLNLVAEQLGKPKFFRRERAPGDDPDLAAMSAPTRDNFDRFVVAAERLTTGNINRHFFRGDVALHDPNGDVRGALTLLTTWLAHHSRPSDAAAVAEALAALREVRELRQTATPSAHPQRRDRALRALQDQLANRLLEALRTLREVMGQPRHG